MAKREAVFIKDTENKKLSVVRAFDAPLERVWQAWSESELLDQWWAPKPYRAETKTMDFREGGYWLYCMVGPKGDRTWCIENYKTIQNHKLISNTNSFCDEEGNINASFPAMNWKNEFDQAGSETTVNVEITFENEADMETIIKMGFKEGFAAGLNNLDEYLTAK